MTATYFDSAAAFRRWLAPNHSSASELLLGFYKKGASKVGITYSEALDEALCFGWIDGVRRRVDDERFTIRFTPRTKRSIWSAVNVRHVERLQREGRMAPAGIAAFAARDPARMNVYAFEGSGKGLDADSERILRKNAKAWRDWSARPPGYRRTAGWWVSSAKKPETRAKRLATLIECSAKGVRIPSLRPDETARTR